jgi:hypothetical protein
VEIFFFDGAVCYCDVVRIESEGCKHGARHTEAFGELMGFAVGLLDDTDRFVAIFELGRIECAVI